MLKFVFHYLGMPHLPVTAEYTACAFTQKVRNLTRMLLVAGHRVFLYGVDHTDLSHPNLTFVPVINLADVRQDYGEGDKDFEIGYNWRIKDFKHDINSAPKPSGLKFFARAIKAIRENSRPDHFLLLAQGVYQRSVAEALKLYLTCEPGIGYRGSFAPFRAFESAFIRNFTYGGEHPRESLNGSYYDRVIPNYFNLADFPFSPNPCRPYYLAYMGRLIIRKGVNIAIRVAQALELPLLVAGQGEISGLQVKPSYPRVKVFKALSGLERAKFLGGAAVLLVPTIYLEPFGGVAVESMLCGTPVVSSNFGVFPETVKNGVTGYRADTLDDFVRLTRLSMILDRHRVRKNALRFSLDQVNLLYEKWWRDLYRLYLSVQDKSVLAWHYIDKQSLA